MKIYCSSQKQLNRYAGRDLWFHGNINNHVAKNGVTTWVRVLDKVPSQYIDTYKVQCVPDFLIEDEYYFDTERIVGWLQDIRNVSYDKIYISDEALTSEELFGDNLWEVEEWIK